MTRCEVIDDLQSIIEQNRPQRQRSWDTVMQKIYVAIDTQSHGRVEVQL